MKQFTYRILLNREPEGGYTVTVPILPGCITYGEMLTKLLQWRERLLGFILKA